MNNNTKLIIGGIAIAVISFFGGVKYDQSKSATAGTTGANFAQGGAQGGFNRTGGTRGAGTRAFNGASGTIVTKDATSITLSLRDGSGSKIIFISPSTTISKMTDGTIADLVVGKDVTVNGTPNTDGSINAQMVSLRPMNFASSTPR